MYVKGCFFEKKCRYKIKDDKQIMSYGRNGFQFHFQRGMYMYIYEIGLNRDI